ncbi:MAG: polyisoprenoid-binding protein [Deltaproteobacteria bacterium]|nr:polyisoprenoid-binding protein [Deltaproteobacteria bacterium]MBF0525641.1 polyisoprenoid-binding protein [Deltaproteobacteria bacterium]
MIKLAGVIMVSLVLMLPSFASASNWTIDPVHSNIQFKIRHLMISNVKGVFGKVQGVIKLDDKDITKSNLTVTIDTASISTGVDKRDEDLKSANFFDVAKFPTMTFVSKKVMKKSMGKLEVIGDLTIHGIAREVVLDVEEFSNEIKDPWGGIRRGASAYTKINRKDFGITWNKTMETGGVMIGDDVFITLEVEMVKEQSK